MFMVLSVQAAPDHLRGYLSRFLMPADVGLHVGVVTPRVADAIWAAVRRTIQNGKAVMITSTRANDHGFEVKIHGDPRRSVIDFDGLELVTTRDQTATVPSNPG